LCATTSAADRGLIGDKPTAAVDGTGLESRHTSRYFFKRSGKEHAARLWTKLTVAVDTATHFLAGARVSAGPSNDSPQFPPVMAQASLVVTWDRVLADAAFDAEAHHAYARDELGVRSSVIPLNRRGQGRRWPKTAYRRQMVKRFRKKPKGSRYRRVYGQRWQAESAFSRHKRRLGSALGARSDAARERECQLRVLTHNLMLLAAHG
jgi:transposase